MSRKPVRRGENHPQAPARITRPNLRGWFGAQLRVVAVLEFAKGALVLVAGLGLLAFVHRDVRDVADELLEHLHLNPASRVPEIFVALAERVTSMDLWLLAIGATVYAAVRIAEGTGSGSTAHGRNGWAPRRA